MIEKKIFTACQIKNNSIHYKIDQIEEDYIMCFFDGFIPFFCKNKTIEDMQTKNILFEHFLHFFPAKKSFKILIKQFQENRDEEIFRKERVCTAKKVMKNNKILKLICTKIIELGESKKFFVTKRALSTLNELIDK